MQSKLVALAGAAMMAASAVAAAKSYPEFGGRCTMGVAMGDNVPTDCSVNWNGPDGNQYCFGDKDAKSQFMESPKSNLQKAFNNYDTVVVEKPQA